MNHSSADSCHLRQSVHLSPLGSTSLTFFPLHLHSSSLPVVIQFVCYDAKKFVCDFYLGFGSVVNKNQRFVLDWLFYFRCHFFPLKDISHSLSPITTLMFFSSKQLFFFVLLTRSDDLSRAWLSSTRSRRPTKTHTRYPRETDNNIQHEKYH